MCSQDHLTSKYRKIDEIKEKLGEEFRAGVYNRPNADEVIIHDVLDAFEKACKEGGYGPEGTVVSINGKGYSMRVGLADLAYMYRCGWEKVVPTLWGDIYGDLEALQKQRNDPDYQQYLRLKEKFEGAVAKPS